MEESRLSTSIQVLAVKCCRASGEKPSSVPPVFSCTFSFVLQSSIDCAHFERHKIFYISIFFHLNCTLSVDNQDSISSDFREMPCHPSLLICLCLSSPGASTEFPPFLHILRSLHTHQITIYRLPFLFKNITTVFLNWAVGIRFHSSIAYSSKFLQYQCARQ